uniref:CUE domain-containing protein n=1 Tax=Rhizophora mucronata TaxID=61149 RepID=A0A2P2LLJ0_RHIMU
MGFKSVYRSLVDVFPQVDSRLLRAFAIEHSKDPDVAVEIVLSEVLPYLSKHSIVSEDLRIGSSVNAEDEGQINEVTHQLTKKIASQCTRFPRLRTHQQTSLEKSISAGETSTANEHTSKIDPATEISRPDSNSQSKEQNPPTVLSIDSNIDINLVQGNEESEEVILLLKHQCQEENVNSSSSQISKTICKASVHENNAACGQISTNIETVEPASMGEAQDMNTRGQSEEISQVMSASLMRKNDDSNGSFIGDVMCVGFDGPGKDECCKKSPQVESVDATLLESENFVNQQKPVVGVTGLSMEVCNNSLSEYENVKSSKDIKIKQFEDIVEGAKNNKNTLFSATESVMNMMRQVKLQEKAAEQAKEEAAGGGLDILIKVLDLKRMLAHAKEANDMHAGEVYGEKAILATEMKELQGRLQILSNERDKSLGILHEVSI